MPALAMANQSASSPDGRYPIGGGGDGGVRYETRELDCEWGRRGWKRPPRPRLDGANEHSKMSWRRSQCLRLDRIKNPRASEKIQTKETAMPPTIVENNDHQGETRIMCQQKQHQQQRTGSKQAAHDNKSKKEEAEERRILAPVGQSGDGVVELGLVEYLARNLNHPIGRQRPPRPRQWARSRVIIKLWAPLGRRKLPESQLACAGRVASVTFANCMLLILLMQITRGPSRQPPFGPIIYQANCVQASALSGGGGGGGGVGPSGFVSSQGFRSSNNDNNDQSERIKTRVRVGILLEEFDYEQANMFIRTIKMINEQKDETIRRLVSVFAAAKRETAGGAGSSGSRDVHSLHPPASMMPQMQTMDHQDDHGDLGAQSEQHPRDRKLAHQLGEPNGESSSASKIHEGLGAEGQVGGSAAHWPGKKYQQQQQQQQQQLASNARTEDARVANDSAQGGVHDASATDARQANQARNAPVVSQFDIKLDPMIEFLRDRHSALEADEKVCQLIESGVEAIFGPTEGRAIAHVQSICDNLEIPYFELRSFLALDSSGSSSGAGGGAGGGPMPGHAPAEIDLAKSLATYNQVNYDNERKRQERKLRAFDDIVTPIFTHNHAHRQNSHTGPSQTTTTTTTTTTTSNKLEALTVNLYPPGHLLNSAYIDLIYALNWTSFAVVYEDGSSMIRLQNIFKETSPSSSWANKWRIRLFRYDGSQTAPAAASDVFESTEAPSSGNRRSQSLEHADLAADQEANVTDTTVNLAKIKRGPDQTPILSQNDRHLYKSSRRDTTETQSGRSTTTTTTSYRDVFWRVKLSGEHNILLDVKTENLYEALKQAQQVGCMTEEYSYLITSLDLHMINLEDFKYSRTKITGLSLLQVAKTRDEPAVASMTAPKFDEHYLENLGLHLIQSARPSGDATKLHGVSTSLRQQQDAASNSKTKTSLSSSSSSSSSSFNWLNEAESNDQTRREMLPSSPASLGLLPTVDRNNEQKLFDFFLEQQRRNLSRVRLSTSSAILHDSLVLFMLGLNELDPSGQFLHDNNRHDNNQEEDEQVEESRHRTHGTKCTLEAQPWAHGSSLVNYMKQIRPFSGLTGLVSFDQRGLRTDFKLDVLGMAPNLRLIKVGEWHSRSAADEARNRFRYHHQQMPAVETGGTSLPTIEPESDELEAATAAAAAAEADANVDAQMDSKSYDELSSRYESQLRRYEQMLASGNQVHVPYRRRVSPNGALLVNEIIFERLYREQADKVDTLIVTAKLSQPYFMLKETPSKLDGNDQFEGYAVDLIHELSKLVNFRYKWREVADKKYGSKEVLANGSVVWNGMIGEIVRGKADLAIVDLTITAQREEAVDFTLPFMNTGISILFKKPTTKVTTLFSFLSPFSSDVWAYVLAAYCGISAILFLVGHLSPYEWADPHPCRHLNHDSGLTVLKNQFSLLNSFWFTIGSLMQQGSDLTPRSMSTRTIAGIWYFFTLIMISSYTANLAAFLTVEKVVYPIENVRDLSNQQEIKYGCVESGSTCLFFHDSQIDTYKKIDETMRRHRTYVRSNDEGQKRVGEGKFAFFMESTTIEYIIERNCNLTQIGGLIDSKGYGLATSKKSRHKRPYRTLLNEGILHLQETGMLHVLKNRWWKEKRGGGTCTDDGKGGGVTELSLANVGGVFVVLLGGLGISFLVAIVEFIWRARRSGSSRDRMCEEMMNDLKFALACKSSTKPIQMTGNGNNFKRITKMSRTIGSGGGGGGPNDGTEPATQTQNSRWRVTPTGQRSIKQQDSFVTTNGLLKYKVGSEYQGQVNNSAVAGGQMKQIGSRVNKKQCDPILLHAMLTMLSSNPDLAAAPQAELDMAAARNHKHEFSGARPLLPHSTTYDENLSRQLHLMNQHANNNSQTNYDYDEQEEEGEEEDDNDDDYEDEEKSDSQQNQQQQQPARTDPPRRRQMLWSQQTIDTD